MKFFLFLFLFALSSTAAFSQTKIITMTPPADGTYGTGATLDFVATFSGPVTVTGSPYLVIAVNSLLYQASYLSGSGSSALTFRYRVVSGTFSSATGITTGSQLKLNGGTIIDGASAPISTTLLNYKYPGIQINAPLPSIVSVQVPSTPPAYYLVGQTIDFDVNWSSVMTQIPSTSGTVSRLKLLIGSTVQYANYISGSGTSTFRYRYTVKYNMEDLDGIQLVSPLEPYGAVIKDSDLNNPTYTFTLPNSSAIKVDAKVPTVVSCVRPSSGTYIGGNNLDFIVTYNRNVIVTGTPRINISIGPAGAARQDYANYIGGSSTNQLTFRYTVQPSDFDMDGVWFNVWIDLNGGSLFDEVGNDGNFGFYGLHTGAGAGASSVFLNGTPAANITSVTPPANGTYRAGEDLNFSVNYSSAVTVSGTPRLALNIGGSPVYANYVSGSGTNTLLFRYSVLANELDTNGISLSSPVDLNSGTITNSSINSNLTFILPDLSAVNVDAVLPTISSVTAPAVGTYTLNNEVDFTVAVSENVVVTGVPYISLIVGSTSRNATYNSSKSTATNLVFTYTVVLNDSDSDGIISLSPFQLNSGSIADSAGNGISSLVFTPPNTAGVLVDGATGITGFTVPANGTYKTGVNMDFVVQYATKATVTGTPRIAIQAGSQTVYANYVSGSNSKFLTFRYTVTSGVYDSDGIVLATPIELNGGSINGINGSAVDFVSPSTAGVLVDGISPTLSSITAPSNGNHRAGLNLSFTANYTYPAVVTGTPRIEVTIGSTTVYATYLSGSGTTAHVYRYTITANELDTDGISIVGPSINLNGGTIKDVFGDNATSNFSSTNYPLVLVDAVAPTISSVTGPANGTYGLNDNLDFTLTASETIYVIGSPRMALNVGGVTRYATYSSGSGTSSLVFRYTIGSGDLDTNGISASSPIGLNSGTLRDMALNSLVLTFTPPDLSQVNVNSLASIVSVTPPPNGTYNAGNELDFTVAYTGTVNVSGTPRIPITVGTTTAYADYVSGSGSASLVFRYTVASGQIDTNGIQLAASIQLNGGTVTDTGGNPASLTFTAPNTSGILVVAGSVSIASITPPADGFYGIGTNMDFIVNYTAAATVTGLPQIQLTVGAATFYAQYLSGSGTEAHTFRYTVGAGQDDSDGITMVGPSILLNGGTIKDAFSNDATITFTGINYLNKKVDTTAPTILSMAASANKTYAEGEFIDLTATYSEAVSITGSPRIALTVGATTVYATYASGSGSSTIVFRYAVGLGLLDTDGITSVSAVALNGGSITDLGTNAQTNFSFTPPTLTGVLVNSISPTIVSLTAPVSQTYTTGGNVNFTVNYSEAVLVTGTPVMQILVGSSPQYASYVSGNGTSSLVFRYTVASGDNDSNGVDATTPLLLNGGTIKDLQGNTASLIFTSQNYAGVRIDAVAPSISSVTVPSDNTYKNGGTRPTLSFIVTYSEPVTVTGIPRIHLTVGQTLRYATYASGSGTSSITFNYAVAADDFDMSGIDISNSGYIDINGGTIRDAVSLNGASYLGSYSTSGIIVVYSSISSWYDITDTSKLVFNGFNVSGLLDKVSTYDLTHSASGVTYNSTNFNSGTNAYVSCSSTSSFVGAKAQTPMAIVAIYRAPANATNQYLFESTAATRPKVQFSSTASGGTVSFGTTGRNYSATSWGTAAATATNVWTTSAVAVRGYSWTSTQNRDQNYCMMDGQLAEMFLFSALPTPAQMTELENYINARYQLVFPAMR